DANAAARGRRQAQQQLDQRGLAHAGGTGDGHRFAGFDLQIAIAQDPWRIGAVAEPETLRLQAHAGKTGLGPGWPIGAGIDPYIESRFGMGVDSYGYLRPGGVA